MEPEQGVYLEREDVEQDIPPNATTVDPDDVPVIDTEGASEAAARQRIESADGPVVLSPGGRPVGEDAVVVDADEADPDHDPRWVNGATETVTTRVPDGWDGHLAVYWVRVTPPEDDDRETATGETADERTPEEETPDGDAVHEGDRHHLAAAPMTVDLAEDVPAWVMLLGWLGGVLGVDRRRIPGPYYRPLPEAVEAAIADHVRAELDRDALRERARDRLEPYEFPVRVGQCAVEGGVDGGFEFTVLYEVELAAIGD